jgi:hypothetical protein
LSYQSRSPSGRGGLGYQPPSLWRP